MAFDGITIHALTAELNEHLLNGRIYKIAQTEKDELILTIKNNRTQYRLLLSVNASLPLIYLTETNKTSPLTAPNFCMLLRKHINNGRIQSITQIGLERIIDFDIEHLNEMGDLCRKHIMVELMGKHSNIIFTDSDLKIIDSIKRINASISTVREVLPGYDYFIPNTLHKKEPLETTKEEFISIVCNKNTSLTKAIYTSYTGLSPQSAEEICFQASLDSNISAIELSENEQLHLANIFIQFMEDVRLNHYQYSIVYESNKPIDFQVLHYSMYDNLITKEFSSVSSMLEKYYAEKNNISRINQRSTDLRQIINTLLERNYKKYDLQYNQLKDTEKKDKYKIYGELLNTYGYNIPDNSKSCEVLNYYTNEQITIPLNPQLTAQENSQKYFARYNKLKRTFQALSQFIVATKNEIDHLESISTSLDITSDYEDLSMIKQELIESGYMKNKPLKKGKVQKPKSVLLHYISSDGFDIFVGKNNLQNDELTFKIAQGNDWWFHAKNLPGSHVIVKTNGADLPDSTFEEAAKIAGYYSKARNQEKVEIDYVEKKYVKKVNGAKPGFVIYHTNYSMTIEPNIENIKNI